MRGFSSVIDHDLSVIDSISKMSNKRTVMWVLGDIAMDIESLYLLGMLDCRIESFHGLVKYKKMWLSHCPILESEMYRCEANVHGHIHKNTNSENTTFPFINVNWDFWRRPLALDEIKELVKKG
jgi:calcineurin-like phosphoesterase family protein